MTIRSFEDVVAWQKGRELNRALFKTLQNNKNFSYKDQLFRASLSITNNIAEGFERGGDKELKQFLVIARGSTAEVRSMLYTALDNEYINQAQFDQFLRQIQEIGRLLTGFIKKLSISRLSDDRTIRQ
jgi:four helix bundle protein